MTIYRPSIFHSGVLVGLFQIRYMEDAVQISGCGCRGVVAHRLRQ